MAAHKLVMGTLPEFCCNAGLVAFSCHLGLVSDEVLEMSFQSLWGNPHYPDKTFFKYFSAIRES